MRIDLSNTKNLDSDIQNTWSNDIFSNMSGSLMLNRTQPYSNFVSSMPITPVITALRNMLDMARANNARTFYFGKQGTQDKIEVETAVDKLTGKYNLFSDLSVSPSDNIESLLMKYGGLSQVDAAGLAPELQPIQSAPKMRPTIEAGILETTTFDAKNAQRQNIKDITPVNTTYPTPNSGGGRGNDTDTGGFTDTSNDTLLGMPKNIAYIVIGLVSLGILAGIGALIHRHMQVNNSKIKK